MSKVTIMANRNLIISSNNNTLTVIRVTTRRGGVLNLFDVTFFFKVEREKLTQI